MLHSEIRFNISLALPPFLISLPCPSCAVSNASVNGLNVTNNCMVTDPPFTTNATVLVSICSNPDKFLFWDGSHPTAQGHKVLAAAIARVFSSYGLLNEGV